MCRSYEGSIKGLQSPFGYNNSVHPEQPTSASQYVPVSAPKDSNSSSHIAVELVDAEVENHNQQHSNNTTNQQQPSKVLDSTLVTETFVKPVRQEESVPVARSIFSFFEGNPPPPG